jgi:hypothetical protein
MIRILLELFKVVEAAFLLHKYGKVVVSFLIQKVLLSAFKSVI